MSRGLLDVGFVDVNVASAGVPGFTIFDERPNGQDDVDADLPRDAEGSSRGHVVYRAEDVVTGESAARASRRPELELTKGRPVSVVERARTRASSARGLADVRVVVVASLRISGSVSRRTDGACSPRARRPSPVALALSVSAPTFESPRAALEMATAVKETPVAAWSRLKLGRYHSRTGTAQR